MDLGGDGEVDKLRALENSKWNSNSTVNFGLGGLEGAGLWIAILDSIRSPWHHYYPLSGGQFSQMYVDTFKLHQCGEYTTSASFV